MDPTRHTGKRGRDLNSPNEIENLSKQDSPVQQGNVSPQDRVARASQSAHNDHVDIEDVDLKRRKVGTGTLESLKRQAEMLVDDLSNGRCSIKEATERYRGVIQAAEKCLNSEDFEMLYAALQDNVLNRISGHVNGDGFSTEDNVQVAIILSLFGNEQQEKEAHGYLAMLDPSDVVSFNTIVGKNKLVILSLIAQSGAEEKKHKALEILTARIGDDHTNPEDKIQIALTLSRFGNEEQRNQARLYLINLDPLDIASAPILEGEKTFILLNIILIGSEDKKNEALSLVLEQLKSDNVPLGDKIQRALAVIRSGDVQQKNEAEHYLVTQNPQSVVSSGAPHILKLSALEVIIRNGNEDQRAEALETVFRFIEQQGHTPETVLTGCVILYQHGSDHQQEYASRKITDLSIDALPLAFRALYPYSATALGSLNVLLKFGGEAQKYFAKQKLLAMNPGLVASTQGVQKKNKLLLLEYIVDHATPEKKAQALGAINSLVDDLDNTTEEKLIAAALLIQSTNVHHKETALHHYFSLSVDDIEKAEVSDKCKAHALKQFIKGGNPQEREDAMRLAIVFMQRSQTPIDVRVICILLVSLNGNEQEQILAKNSMLGLPPEMVLRSGLENDKTLSILQLMFHEGDERSRENILSAARARVREINEITGIKMMLSEFVYNYGNSEAKYDVQTMILRLNLEEVLASKIAIKAKIFVLSFLSRHGDQNQKANALAKIEFIIQHPSCTMPIRTIGAIYLHALGNEQQKRTAINAIESAIERSDQPLIDAIVLALLNHVATKNNEEEQEEAMHFILSLIKSSSINDKDKAYQQSLKALEQADQIWISNRDKQEDILNVLIYDIIKNPHVIREIIRDVRKEKYPCYAAMTGNRILSKSNRRDDPRYPLLVAIEGDLRESADHGTSTIYDIYIDGVHKSIDALNHMKNPPIDLEFPDEEIDGIIYAHSNAYLRIPNPELPEIPNITHTNFLELLDHLEQAAMHCSKEQKIIILRGWGVNAEDLEAWDDARLNASIQNVIQQLNVVAQHSEIKLWMDPNTKMSTTRYELLALLYEANQALETWKAAGEVYGDELSEAASRMLQLMLNITTCESGKKAGVHKAFVMTPGLQQSGDLERLKNQASPAIQRALVSTDESDARKQPALVDFMQDAYQAYLDFRSNRLDGDGAFIKAITGTEEGDSVAQPSHQNDYALLVLGKALGLLNEDEDPDIDLYGHTIHPNLIGSNAITLLEMYFGTQDDQNNFIHALIDYFMQHWSAQIELGLNNPNASPEEKKGYEQFIQVISLLGISSNDCFDYNYNEGTDEDVFTLKRAAVVNMLSHLGILDAIGF